jgi:hypothetical protein
MSPRWDSPLTVILTPFFDSAARLLVDSDTHVRTQPALRSGLYIITTPEPTGGSHQIFVLYWPEQTTWDDSAASSVRRNRITFMRFVQTDAIRNDRRRHASCTGT